LVNDSEHAGISRGWPDKQTAIRMIYAEISVISFKTRSNGQFGRFSLKKIGSYGLAFPRRIIKKVVTQISTTRGHIAVSYSSAVPPIDA
jgi:hypothetical protein